MPRFVVAMSRQTLGSLRDLAPIFAVIAFFQIVVLRQPFPDLVSVAVGLVAVVLGLALFIQGLESGLFPLGEALAEGMARKGSVFALLAMAFCLGFGTTVAEPALIAVAAEAADVAAEAGFIRGSQAAREGYALELRLVVGRCRWSGHRLGSAAHREGVAHPPLHHRRVRPGHGNDHLRSRGDRWGGVRLGRRYDQHHHRGRSSPPLASGSRPPSAGATRCLTASASSPLPA